MFLAMCIALLGDSPPKLVVVQQVLSVFNVWLLFHIAGGYMSDRRAAGVAGLFLIEPYHLFYLLMPSLESRQGLIAHLKERGILSVFHYLPLHTSEMGRKFGGRDSDCPVTEEVSDRLVRLPFYNDLSEADQAYVAAAIVEFLPRTNS